MSPKPFPNHKLFNDARVRMGWTLENLHEALERYSWPTGVAAPSPSTVGHWCNGTRRPRNMHHLRGLCDVLGIDLEVATGGKAREARTAVEQALLAELRDMSPEDAELVLLTARHLRLRTKTPK